ncbi:MAG: primosomal protein N', partial [Methylocystis silviterrae]
MSAAHDEEERARVVEILAPVAVDSTYSYLAPAAMRLSPGDSVTAPLGRREAYGVVWSIGGDSGPGGNLKTVSARLDRPPLSQKLRGFIDWLARYTLSPRGMALRLATRAAEDAGPATPRMLYRASGVTPERLTPTRARVLKAAEGGVAFAKKALAEAAACSTGVIDALVDEGALETIAAPPAPISPPLDPQFAAPALEPAQQDAADALKASL